MHKPSCTIASRIPNTFLPPLLPPLPLSYLQVGDLEITFHRDRVLLGVGALDVDGDGRHARRLRSGKCL